MTTTATHVAVITTDDPDVVDRLQAALYQLNYERPEGTPPYIITFGSTYSTPGRWHLLAHLSAAEPSVERSGRLRDGEWEIRDLR